MRIRPLLWTLAVALGCAARPAVAEEQAIELEPLYVETTVIADRTADDLTHPAEVLAGDELERRRAGTVGELLGGVLGIGNSSFGPGVGRPVIRGQGGARVQILENGIRTMDISTISPDHAVSVDPLNARQVEVFKGPATLIYGSGASGGVVNVLNNRMPQDFDPGWTGNAGYSWSVNGQERLGNVDLTHGWDNVALQADFGYRRANDFSIPGFQEVGQEPGEGRTGTLQNSGMENHSGALSAAWTGLRGYLGMALSRIDNDYGIPEVIDPDDPEFERIELEQTRFDSRGELLDPVPGVFTRARMTFGYNDYQQQELEFEDESKEVENDFDNEEWELRFDLTHVAVGPFMGVIGAHFTGRDFRAESEDGGEFFIQPTETRSWAVFLVEEVPVDWGRVDIGVRYESNRTEPEAGRSRRFSLFSLSSGLLWEIDELHHLKFSFNRAERAPAPEELFSDGRHAATRSFDIGDPGLGSETANEVELGLDRHSSRWHWRVNVFYNRTDDFIFQEFQVSEDGEIIFVDDDGGIEGIPRNRLTRFRQRDAEFYGIEAETRYALVDDGPVRLNARVFGDHVRGELRDTGEDLPRITPTRFGISLDGGWGPVDGFVELTRSNSQDRIAQGETPTDTFTLLGFDLGYTLPGRGAKTRFYLRGRNLLDSEVRLHTSFLKDDAPQPGRTVLAGARVEF